MTMSQASIASENTSDKQNKKNTRVVSASVIRKRKKAKESKRKVIMQAALDLFSRSGVHGTSIEQVAAHAEVSKTNLLYYFNSKEQLYLGVLQQLLDVWLQPLQNFSQEQDPIHAIGDYIRVKLELSRDNPAESRLFCMEVLQGAPLILDELKSPLRDLIEAKVQVIRHWIEAGKLAPVDPYHLIFSIWATTQHYADFRTQVEAVTGKNLHDPDFFAEALHNVQTIILGGVRPRL
ncbi:MAG: HTH-type transcriptional regulator RutR [Paraglaciecola sp.]|uniref:HTH-type transcriptional regulator RutR n=1 Tax=Pseudomonadati TaxID=3379134 RepID=UPI00273DDB94|nr:HTH-type transcriptional regulator RutR [Paraglaciecola sp.]MDP5031243.1 HTH-type transcriptional regulator RutR [Paraglaciecola sp.]MDP5132873.1 HTH-type transcriptional regulator RutR [Paraglaciecola sp.]